MKYKCLKFMFIIFVAIFLVSCRNKDNNQPYIIETDPIEQSVDHNTDIDDPIDDPNDNLSDDWNGISYLSKEIISYDKMFEVITDKKDDRINRIDYLLFNLNNASVFITNDNYKYVSRNEETINKLIDVVKTNYRLLDADSDEIRNLFNDITGNTLVSLYLEEYRITFYFLRSGEIVVFNTMCCVSQKKYDKKLFNSFILAAKDDYNASNKKLDIDLDNIDVSGLSIEEIKGYDKLNFQDYTSENFKYNFNYRLEVKLSDQLLITNTHGECFIYDTGLVFSSPYDYIDYMIEYLKFDQFPNLTKDEFSRYIVSFDIGELTEEKINYILKLKSLYLYIDSISISDNHYYEVLQPGDDYLVVRGSIKGLYKIIASYEELIQAVVNNEISIEFEIAASLDERNKFGREYADAIKAFYDENIKKLDRYDSSYFENKFLYIYGDRLGINCGDAHFVINQQGGNIEFIRLFSAPITEYEHNNLYILEMDKIDGINPHHYSFNGVVEDYATVTYHIGEEVTEKEYLKGTVISLSSYYSLDPLFKNIIRDVVVEDDIDLYCIKLHNSSRLLGYDYSYFIVKDHLELSREIAYESSQALSLNGIKQMLGLNIDAIYGDADLTKQVSISSDNTVYLSSDNIYWVTLAEEDSCIVHEINEKCDLEVKDSASIRYLKYNKIEIVDGEINFLIRRLSYPKMGDIEYVLKEVVDYPDETLFVLERNYYNYEYSGSSLEMFYDEVKIKVTDDLLANTTNVSFIIDDSMILEDRYIRTSGVKTIFNPETSPLNINVEFLDLVPWFNITDVYEENKDAIVFDSCNGNYNLVNRYGRVDYTKSDLSFFKQYFGNDFKFSDYYIYVLEYYSNINISKVEHYYTSMSCGSFEIDAIYKNLNDTDYEEKISKHVEMLAVKKSDLDYYMPSGIPKFKKSDALYYTKAQVTISYAVGGKEYGINDLAPHFDDVYDDGIIAIEKTNFSTKVSELSGFRPSRNTYIDYNSMSISFLSKRQVTNEKDINVSYKFKSYDYKKHIIYIDRCYHDAEGDSVDMTCYDLITFYGCADNIFGYRGNDIPDDLVIVVNDIR